MKLIVAIGKNREIGVKGDLPWHISEDLKRFKALTLEKTVVMGRKTWESLPKRPLPKRTNIVVTRNEGYEAPGAIVVHSLEEASKIADEKGESFIIGGAEIYRQALPYADTILFTEVDMEVPDADAFFPDLPAEWVETEASDWYTTDDGTRYRFTTYHRN